MSKSMGLAAGASLFALFAIAAAWEHYLIPAIVCGALALGFALPLLKRGPADT